MVSAWCVPILASRTRSRVPLAAALCGCGTIGFAILGGGAPLLWGVALLALGQGGAFPLALVLIPLKSENTHVATALSTVVQGVGFAGAGAGLAALALLRADVGSWLVLWWLLAGAGLTQAVLACLAAQHGQLSWAARSAPNPRPSLQESVR
jgi:CP family cyanate transporter-like MFS transporter